MDTKTDARTLFRSRRQKMIAGVCGGFAEYIHMDVTLVRLFWILAAMLNGAGILAYFVCLILMRENPEPLSEEEISSTAKKPNTEVVVGLIFLLLGATILLRNATGSDWWLPWHWHHLLQVRVSEIGPILLIALGVGVLLQRHHAVTNPDAKSAPVRRKLLRSRDERMIGGVCGGLAQYWRIDTTLVRIVWVLTTLLVHLLAGGLCYILLLVLIPERDNSKEFSLS